MADYRITIELVGKDRASGAVAAVAGALGSIGEIAAGILAAKVFQAIASGLADMARQAIAAASYFQTLTIRMETLLRLQSDGTSVAQGLAGSFDTQSSAAERLLGWVRKIGVTTPFSVERIADTVSMGLAMGFTEEQTKKMTTSAVDFTAAMGLQDDVMWRIVYNFAQMKQQGKVTGTELRDLARGALVPITDVLHRMQEDLGMTNISFDKFHKLAAKGKVDVNAFFTAFNEIVGEKMQGAAARMSETMMGVSNNIKDLIESVLGGLVLKPMFDDIAKAANNFIQSLLVPEVQDLFGHMGKTLETVVRLFGELVGGAADFKGIDLVGSLEKVNRFLGNLENILFDIKIGRYDVALKNLGFSDDQVGAILDFADGVNGFVADLKSIPEKATSFFDSIKLFLAQDDNQKWKSFHNFVADLSNMDTHQWIEFGNFLTTIRDALPVVQAWLQTIWVIIQDVAAVIGPTLAPAFAHLGETLKNLFTPELANTILQVLGIIAAAVGSILLLLVGTVVGIVNGIITAIDLAMQWFQATVMPAIAIISEGIQNLLGGNVWEGIKQIIGGTLLAIAGLFVTAGGLILGFLLGFINGVIQFFINLKDELVGHSIIPDMLNSIIDWFHTKFDELLAFIRDLIPKLIQAGTDLIAGLWQGFKDRWAQFLSDSKALIEGLPKWVKKILGIASPSKVFMDIGQQITRGLMIGMTGQQNNLRGAAQQISNVNFNVQPGFLFRSEDNFVRDMQLLNNLYGGRA